MNGDGFQDIVRVNGAGVIYWPYLGNGRWAEPITMKKPPVLPLQFDPKRLFLSDIDGDGCADLIYVDFDKVILWLNQSGVQLSSPKEILYTPPVSVEQVRLADMKGTGTAGILWSYIGPASHGADYFYLDFTGGVKPYLLSRIDNGMGLVTKIEYGTSTTEAMRDRLDGSPWTTFLPFPVPVIKSIHITDQVTNCQSLSKYQYHNGHFDGISRDFAGFGMVEVEEVGDDSVPTMLTRNWHHLGLDPNDYTRYLSDLERSRLRALRGRLLKTEVYGLDGSPDQDKPYFRTENKWDYRVEETVKGVEVLFPYLSEIRTSHFERQVIPYRMMITRNLSYDAHGNVTEQEQWAEDPRDPTLTRVLRTVIIFANDPSGRFISKPTRIIQSDGSEQIVAETISYYDELPEGQIGAEGLLTRQETLVLTDEVVLQVYGANPPDFASLGYHRHSNENGWWIDQVSYTRVDDASGLRGTVTNARGNTTNILFDPYKIHPAKVVDALGNTMEALYDYRVNKLQILTDANGSTISNHYDPLGRLLKTIDPGGNDVLPTTSYIYNINQLPVQLITEQRAINGQPEVIKRKTYVDGLGQVIEERVVNEQGDIVERSQLYSARGLIKIQFLPYVPVSSDYTLPTTSLPHRRFHYDALGRLIDVLNPDGSIQKQHFEPGVTFLYDEEDSREDSEAYHTNTPTRHNYDPTGHIKEVALNDGGRWISTYYDYDIKGNLIVVDSSSQHTVFWYDLLGRRLRTDSPSSGTTLFVFDANGNQVERRNAEGKVVCFEFDELDRLKLVFSPATGEVFADYLYHDAARPAPVEAGSFTKGRVVKVSHPGGEEIFDYDALGHVIHKVIHPSGLLSGQELIFDFTYRADGQWDTITYPSSAPNVERLRVKYEYNQRGLLNQISNFIRHIDYNLAGQRIRIEYGNNVVTEYEYDPMTFRLKDLITKDGSNAVLQESHYYYDEVGNILKVDSPDPKKATEYIYDDIYRLKQASTQSGESWSYQYDDLGNLIVKSDVGDYQYNANGLLISVGTDTFTYTHIGQMLNTPWGECEYDPIGRLKLITRGSEQMICTYDHNGRRVRMQVIGASSLDVLTPDDMISIENGITFAYIFDGSVRVAQICFDTGTISYLHGDHLGSTTLVTGPTGQILQKVYYEPFGAILENSISVGADGTRFLYTGQICDTWTGLCYLQTRYYNPKLGRFITPDSLVSDLFHPQAWNRYSYVQNNPLRFIDPTGHFWKEIGNWFENSWKYIVAGVAIGAVAVLTVLTAGTFAAAMGIAVGWVYGGVAAGMAIGGVVGGISAYQAGGDILLGVFTGMAVGGGSALASIGIGAGMSAVFGVKSLSATTFTGILGGAVSGIAMGFTEGFAGGQGTAGEIWAKIWQGALAGAVSGAIFGFGGYAFGKGWLGTGKLDLVFPKGTDALKRVGIGFAAGSAAELGRQYASGGELNWLEIVLAGVGGAGIGSFVKFGRNSGLPVLTFLKPEYVGVVSSIFASSVSAIFVLDYADDIWEFLKEKEVKIEIKGTF
ncbi:MAG TPA: toxin TcdB middle/N-terminal domain-containing protein [Dictyoglomaceae bacterium]|nr:toxin TcdB middle/N-terminal domain-containing protein [Dictyoglomaceae bacterium]